MFICNVHDPVLGYILIRPIHDDARRDKAMTHNVMIRIDGAVVGLISRLPARMYHPATIRADAVTLVVTVAD